MKHPSFTRHFRHFLPLLLSLSMAVLAAACKPAEPPPPSGPPAREYQVKGLVGSVAADGREIHIHHEAIPEFVGIDGQAEPMESMSMPFPVADPALVKGIAAGDRIDFTFRVDWEGKRPLEVNRIQKLPPEARLAFEKGLP
jgi:Cu/Ag efflux protein CusF